MRGPRTKLGHGLLSVYLGQVFLGPWHAPEPFRMMPIFPVLGAALPVNRIWLFTEVGQHVQMPQGILVLQESKEAREHLATQSARLLLRSNTKPVTSTRDSRSV